jgi:hypothetical protein
MYFTFLDPGLSKNLISVNEITKPDPYLDVAFWGERCFVVDKRRNQKTASSIKEQGLCQLVEDEVAKSHAMVTRSGSNNNLWHQNIWAIEFSVPLLLAKGRMMVRIQEICAKKK